jgi:ribosomal protein L37E
MEVDLIRCPKCGQGLNSAAQFCTSCGFKLNAQPKTENIAKKNVYITIAIGTILIIVAISLVTSSKFIYYLENISYFADQYADNKSHSSGFLGSIYSSLASQWKELYNEAVTYVALHGVGAGILAICGSIGLLRGLKMLKRLRAAER